MTFYYGMDFSDKAYNMKVLLQMIAFFSVYFVFYKIVRKSRPYERPVYCNRIVTMVHALFCCFFAIYYIVLPALGIIKSKSLVVTRLD